MRGFRLGLLIAVVLSVLVPAVGKAAYTSPGLYDCEPRDPNIARPSAAARPATRRRSKAGQGDCQRRFRGGLPERRSPRADPDPQVPKRLPPARSLLRRGGGQQGTGRQAYFAPVGSDARPEGLRGDRVSYRTERLLVLLVHRPVRDIDAKKGVNSLFAVQTNEQPYIPTGENELGSHSSAQIWAIRDSGRGCRSTAETGWSESLGQFKDVSPHLFVYSMDCGGNGVYSSNEYGGFYWVQSSAVTFPNQALTHNDAFHVYGARMTGNNWWIYYDGQWVGYIPHSRWTYLFPNADQRSSGGRRGDDGQLLDTARTWDTRPSSVAIQGPPCSAASGTSTTTTRRARTRISISYSSDPSITRPETGPRRPTMATRSVMAARGGAEATTVAHRVRPSTVVAIRRARVRLACLAALTLVGAFWASATAAPASEVVTRPPVVEVTTWHAVIPETLRSPAKGPVIKGHRVGLFMEGGYRLGGPKPEYDHVTLVELPRPRCAPFPLRSLPRTSDGRNIRIRPAPGPDYGKCLRMDRTIFRRIHTKRPASGLRLYDGYFSPPRQVWPAVQR